MDCNNNDQYEYQAQVTDVWTLSPSIVNEARVSTIRTFGTWFSPNQGQGYPAKLGLANPAADAFPGITIGGTVGTSISGGLSAVLGFTSYVTSDTVTWVKGKHIIKFGGELDKWQDNQAWDNKRSGNFDFNGIFTRNPADPTSAGLGYADFLIGLPDTWSVGNAPETGMRNWNVQMFAQDDYKIKRNLTIEFRRSLSTADRMGGTAQPAGQLRSCDHQSRNRNTRRTLVRGTKWTAGIAEDRAGLLCAAAWFCVVTAPELVRARRLSECSRTCGEQIATHRAWARDGPYKGSRRRPIWLLRSLRCRKDRPSRFTPTLRISAPRC